LISSSRIGALFAALILVVACSHAATEQPAQPVATIDQVGSSNLVPAVGKVDVVTGQVRIASTGNATRIAVVGMVVSEGDFILTDNASEALITMSDQGFIAVRPNSRVEILSYKADGGDDDNGIFRLAKGGMRSVTGWIGKFNRAAYRIQTPTATIGIRGTDHETRYLPPGSSEGPAGTYDKVFIGVTSIETDAGEADIGADTAGYVASDEERPRVLASIPSFFQPGPNEDLINAKHAEIQNIIEQRREERRRVVEQLRVSMIKAMDDLKAQGDLNKASSDQRAAENDQQRAVSDQKRAVLRAREDALDTQRKIVADLRMQITREVNPFIAANRGAAKDLKAARDHNLEIQQEFKELAADRRDMVERNVAATEARKRAADAHRQAADQKLNTLKAMVPDLQQRYRANQQAGQSLADALAKDPAGSVALTDQRHALDAAVDEERRQRALYQEGMNALFQDNMAFAEDNMKAAIQQRLLTDQMITSFHQRESDLVSRQQANDLVRESIQEGAVTDPEVKARVHALIAQVHAAMAVIAQQRAAAREEYLRVHKDDFTAYGQRQEAGINEIRVIREKHAQFTGKLADLEAESAAMQQEIRSLYDEEQRRYLQELNSARTEKATIPETPAPPPEP
jgi:hypothetical protein